MNENTQTSMDAKSYTIEVLANKVAEAEKERALLQFQILLKDQEIAQLKGQTE